MISFIFFFLGGGGGGGGGRGQCMQQYHHDSVYVVDIHNQLSFKQNISSFCCFSQTEDRRGNVRRVLLQ